MIDMQKLEQKIRSVPAHERDKTAEHMRASAAIADTVLKSSPDILFEAAQRALRQEMEQQERHQDQFSVLQLMIVMAALAAFSQVKNDPVRREEMVKLAREGLKRDVEAICKQIAGGSPHE